MFFESVNGTYDENPIYIFWTTEQNLYSLISPRVCAARQQFPIACEAGIPHIAGRGYSQRGRRQAATPVLGSSARGFRGLVSNGYSHSSLSSATIRLDRALLRSRWDRMHTLDICPAIRTAICCSVFFFFDYWHQRAQPHLDGATRAFGSRSPIDQTYEVIFKAHSRL